MCGIKQQSYDNAGVIKKGALGRWYIENRDQPHLAWSGSRWVDHTDGLGLVVQVSNFASMEEALLEALRVL